MVITFSSMKGGCGKSTSTILTSRCLAKRGFKVLVVDLDLNNSSTIHFTSGIKDISSICEQKNIFEALNRRFTSNYNVLNYVVHTRFENIDIIPSSLNLCDIRTIDTKQLKNILPVDHYDFIIIDTAPTYDNHTISAYNAADYIFTPVQMDSFNLTTTKFLQVRLSMDHGEKINPSDNRWFLISSQWQPTMEQFNMSTQMQYANIFEHEYQNILQVKLPQTENIKKVLFAGESVNLDSRVTGNARLAQAYNDLCDMLTGEVKVVRVF